MFQDRSYSYKILFLIEKNWLFKGLHDIQLSLDIDTENIFVLKGKLKLYNVQ